MLETARLLVADPSIKLVAPIVFVFNGGEETFSQAAHGFMQVCSAAPSVMPCSLLHCERKTLDEVVLLAHRNMTVHWAHSSTWSPRGQEARTTCSSRQVHCHRGARVQVACHLLSHLTTCLSAGGWPAAAYARSAKHPRGAVIGQDIFESGAPSPVSVLADGGRSHACNVQWAALRQRCYSVPPQSHTPSLQQVCCQQTRTIACSPTSTSAPCPGWTSPSCWTAPPTTPTATPCSASAPAPCRSASTSIPCTPTSHLSFGRRQVRSNRSPLAANSALVLRRRRGD